MGKFFNEILLNRNFGTNRRPSLSNDLRKDWNEAIQTAAKESVVATDGLQSGEPRLDDTHAIAQGVEVTKRGCGDRRASKSSARKKGVQRKTNN